MPLLHDDGLTNKVLHRNSICLTIGQAIGIPMPYICRPIVGLNSNYNYNYTFGSSETNNLHMMFSIVVEFIHD